MIATHIPEKFTGIIQLSPSDESHMRDLQSMIITEYPNQKRIGKVDKDGTFVSKLHLTLLHQAIPKLTNDSNGVRGDKVLKKYFKSDARSNVTTPKLELGMVGIKTEDGRTSTYIRVENPSEIRTYLYGVLEDAGLDADVIKALSETDFREAGRLFHISLTNLTGNSGDSCPNILNGVVIGVLG